ncbi:hypothetical protein JD844_005720 [Phrynosoma platyrhinos]|uniref:Ig-like domain-containing protein n=1 Tax=Phrynosoma platyrhinos TaxID=52577 RepID=A0ABQ7TNZ6_PHRPL|nr:hypothetical protein JD844_005720 [Phrynosoma platyrhinos]
MRSPCSSPRLLQQLAGSSSLCYIDQQVTRVAWLNRSNILYAGNDKWSIDSRVELLTYSPSEFSIMITHVDVYDEGLYTCSFQTQDKPHTSQVYLIVHGAQYYFDTHCLSPPYLHSPSTDCEHLISCDCERGKQCESALSSDGETRANCNLAATESFDERQPLHVGGIDNSVVVVYGFTSEGEYLEITEINRQQAGEYECITANGVSTPDSKHPPTITDMKDSRPMLGKTALLRCEAMAVPPAEFQWFKDDKQLVGGLDGLQIQNERTRSILLFPNVTSRHYGNYTCLASNNLGSFNVSLRLLSEFLLFLLLHSPLLAATGLWLGPGEAFLASIFQRLEPLLKDLGASSLRGPGSLENMAAASLGSPLFLGLLSSAFVTLLFKI